MRNILLLTLLLTSNFVFAQLLTFNFDATTGTPASAPSSSDANGIQSSVISRNTAAGGLTAQSGNGVFASSAFTTANVIGTDDYLTFFIRPETGYKFSLTSISVVASRNNQGPTSLVIRTGLDNFGANATNVATVTTGTTTLQLVFLAPVTNITAPVEIRIYGYNAQNNNGTLMIGGLTGADITVQGPPPVVLPVKFANITATKRAAGIEVAFSNLTESEVPNYSIERSANGQQFVSISSIVPVKNDGGSADYKFMDAQPLSGVNYYRIRVIEKAGKISYSNLVKLNAGLIQTGMTIYPNPIKGSQLSFQLNNLPAGMYKVMVHNAAGQVVTSQSIKHDGGTFGETLHMSTLNKGVYYLEVSGTENLRKSFVVQ